MSSARAGRSPRTAWRSCCEADDAAGTRGATARHRRAALSSSASVPRAPARRQVHERPGPGLGAQSLLLPGHDPGEGRQPDRALRRFRDCAGNGAAASSTTTARARATAASRAGSSSPTGSGSTATTSSRSRACCRRRDSRSRPMCTSCATRRCWKPIASSLTELFSPQIISERIDGMLKSYDFVSADTLAYFSKRPPLAQRDSDFALDYVKRNAKTPDAQQARAQGARIQVRRAVGDARRALPCLCGAQACSARRLRAEGWSSA